MLQFISCLFAGILVAFVYRILRHKFIFPRKPSENIYIAWLKITIAIVVPFSVLWVIFIAVQSFPD